MSGKPKDLGLSGDARIVDHLARGRRTEWVATELGCSARTVRRRAAALAGEIAARRKELAANLPPVPAEDAEPSADIVEAAPVTLQRWLDTAKELFLAARAERDTPVMLEMVRLAIVLLRRLVEVTPPPEHVPDPIDFQAAAARVRQRFADCLAAIEAES